MLVVSLLAIAIAAARIKALAVPFAALSFFCFTVQLALYATTQVGAPLSRISNLQPLNLTLIRGASWPLLHHGDCAYL